MPCPFRVSMKALALTERSNNNSHDIGVKGVYITWKISK